MEKKEDGYEISFLLEIHKIWRVVKRIFFTFSQQNEFSTKISRNILSFQIHLLLLQYIQYQAPSTIDIIRKFTQRLNTFFLREKIRNQDWKKRAGGDSSEPINVYQKHISKMIKG